MNPLVSPGRFPRVVAGPRDRAVLEQLRAAGRVPEPPDIEQDYRASVVQKPWGFEFLAYDTPEAAVWRLRINAGHSTSMHCHPRKRTALIVLAGSALCHVFDRRFALEAYDVLILEPGVFHATKGTGPEGVDLIEVETPRCKTDLVRLNDLYGREAAGYETSRHMHVERLERFEHFSLDVPSGGASPVSYLDPQQRFQLGVRTMSAAALSRWSASPESRALVVLSGGIDDRQGAAVAGVGEAASPLAVAGCRPHHLMPLVALTVDQPVSAARTEPSVAV